MKIKTCLVVISIWITSKSSFVYSISFRNRYHLAFSTAFKQKIVYFFRIDHIFFLKSRFSNCHIGRLWPSIKGALNDLKVREKQLKTHENRQELCKVPCANFTYIILFCLQRICSSCQTATLISSTFCHRHAQSSHTFSKIYFNLNQKTRKHTSKWAQTRDTLWLWPIVSLASAFWQCHFASKR